MNSLFKTTLLLFMIPLLTHAKDDVKKHEKSRNIKKQYTISKNGKVSINNKYGDVKVTTWTKNQVEINVTITVKGDDLDDVEEKFDNIDVIFEANNNFISARTTFEKERKSWSFWKNNNNISYKINYDVKMPETNKVDLNNDYGSIFLDNLLGTANIDCDYGKISIGQLSAENNSINLDYCSSSTIGFIKSGNINADYSKLTIEDSENLKINVDYTSLAIEKTAIVDINTDYGSVTIDEAIAVNVNSDYTGLRFGTIRKSLTVDTDYGAVSVKNLAKGFDFVTINGEYAGIRIDVETGAVFNFEIDLQYASFKGDESKMEIFKRISKSSKKYYEGKYGKGNTNSKIKINSQYGGVSIKENN